MSDQDFWASHDPELDSAQVFSVNKTGEFMILKYDQKTDLFDWHPVERKMK